MQALDAISEKLGVEIGENYALMYANTPLPDSDLLSAHFPERYDDGVAGSQSSASFYCHLEDVEATRQAKVQTNIQLVHAISRFKALGQRARDSMVEQMTAHRAARERAVTQREILSAHDVSCQRELLEVEQQIAALEAGAAKSVSAGLSLEPELEPEPEIEPREAAGQTVAERWQARQLEETSQPGVHSSQAKVTVIGR
jgi:hypothetical protein